MIRLLLIIGTGGFVGSVSRFLTARYVQNFAFSAFPYGTFVVNILGCLLIGLLYGLSEKGDLLTAEWRLFLTVGFCGGFTTFSSFAIENFNLLKENDIFYFSLYTGLSVFAGLLATFLGNFITKLF